MADRRFQSRLGGILALTHLESPTCIHPDIPFPLPPYKYLFILQYHHLKHRGVEYGDVSFFRLHNSKHNTIFILLSRLNDATLNSQIFPVHLQRPRTHAPQTHLSPVFTHQPILAESLVIQAVGLGRTLMLVCTQTPVTITCETCLIGKG